jgi:hypothetical protein
MGRMADGKDGSFTDYPCKWKELTSRGSYGGSFLESKYYMKSSVSMYEYGCGQTEQQQPPTDQQNLPYSGVRSYVDATTKYEHANMLSHAQDEKKNA